MSIIEKFMDKIGPGAINTSGVRAEKFPEDNQAIDNFSRQGDNDDFDPGIITDSSKEVFDSNNTQSGTANSNIVNLDFEKLDGLDLLTPYTKNYVLIEQFRQIKLNILSGLRNAHAANDFDVNYNNIFLVTSALEGEGKTYISLNLALSLAYEYNRTVLYIDADIFKKRASIIVSLDKKQGLSDYLQDDKMDLSPVLYRSNIPKLSFLPAGTATDKVTELYSSARMSNLMRELSARYSDRIIIIDSPPLLADSSSTALVANVDQIILVLEAEKTQRHEFNKAVRKTANCSNVSVILNKSNQPTDSGYSYYATKQG